MNASGCALSEDMLHQAFPNVLLNVEDIDVEDGTDPNLCSDYVKNIYKFYVTRSTDPIPSTQESQRIRPKYLAGQEINGNMWTILIDWLVQVQMKFILQQETLYMTIAIIDLFLQDNAVLRMMLQLVGVTAMFIACKYEELYPPCVGDFTYVSDYAYTKLKICEMETKILQALGFGLGRPLPPHFLRRASKIAKVNFKQHVDYDMVHFPPSKIAAAASCLALKLLNGCEWTPTLQHCMSYTESDLLPVMQHLAKNVVLVNEGIIKHTLRHPRGGVAAPRANPGGLLALSTGVQARVHAGSTNVVAETASAALFKLQYRSVLTDRSAAVIHPATPSSASRRILVRAAPAPLLCHEYLTVLLLPSRYLSEKHPGEGAALCAPRVQSSSPVQNELTNAPPSPPAPLPQARPPRRRPKTARPSAETPMQKKRPSIGRKRVGCWGAPPHQAETIAEGRARDV
ncbi:LOW QUALITY PROTEIN: G2/mitotic-specific cyclin-B1-like [Chlamydotis macqueenii]